MSQPALLEFCGLSRLTGVENKVFVCSFQKQNSWSHDLGASYCDTQPAQSSGSQPGRMEEACVDVRGRAVVCRPVEIDSVALGF